MDKLQLFSSLVLLATACSHEDGKAPGPIQGNGGGPETSSSLASGGANPVGSGGNGASGQATSDAAQGGTRLVGSGGSTGSAATGTSTVAAGGSGTTTLGTAASGGIKSTPAAGGSGNGRGGAVSTGGTRHSAGGATNTVTSGGMGPSGGAATSLPGGSSSTSGCGAECANVAAGACTAPQVRVTAVALGAALSFDTSETGVLPLAIAAKPNGGSRIAWMTGYGTNASSASGLIHVADLDCSDKIVGIPFTLPAHDFQDLAADANGGVLLLTRDAQGGGTLNCGDPTALCGTPPSPPVACYDMYLVRHDCAGTERWATKLTSSSAAQVPYSSGSGYNYMVWWYQHHGRLASDGTNYAAYFCDGIVVKNGTCVDIHQGDRMKVVDASGATLSGHDSFDLGCSHSGFTRIIWDAAAAKFIMVCKTDNSNRIAQPNPYRTVMPVTLDGSYVGDLVPARAGGYWLTVSNAGALHLLHFNNGAQADQDKSLGSGNYPHLVRYGQSQMLAVWSSAATGTMTAQVFDTDGTQVSEPFAISAPNHPYQSFKSFPDGSAAFASVASSNATIQVTRVMPCAQ